MAAWQERSGLQDISNFGGRRNGAHGKPFEMNGGKVQLFLQLIEAAGVMGWTNPARGGAAGALEIADPRRLRRQLESRLQRDSVLRARWLEGLQEACEDEAMLHRALLPMLLAVPPSVGSGPGTSSFLAAGGGSCGDSFLRCVLSVACLQAPVATWLLHRLPVLAMAEPSASSALIGSNGGGGGAAGRTGGLPGLVLSQLRWLDVLPDVGGGGGGDDGSPMVDVVLEVLPLMPPELQRQLIGLLPEVASVDDHARIVEKLSELLDSELGFVAPTLEALQQLQLGPDLQDQVVLDMVHRLPGVDSDDLPALVRFVVQYSTGPPSTGGPGGGIGGRGGGIGGGGGAAAASVATATAPSVIAALRGGLLMVDLSDPRVSVFDPKGKRGTSGEQEPVEVRLLRELVVALAANDAAAGAILRAISATGARVPSNLGGSSAPDLEPDIANGDDQVEENPVPEGRGGAAAAAALADGPQKLVPLDLWILLALLGGRRGKEAEKILRAKICEGAASPSWMSCVLLGHAVALKEVWAATMGLAATLAASRPSGSLLAAVGAKLYAVMFAAMGGREDSLHRIEVLHAIHSHLGSGVAEEMDTALAALAQLAEGPLSRPFTNSGGGCGGPRAPALSQYGSTLSNCLDHLESFSDSQLAQLFDVLAAVTGGAEGVAWRAAAEARAAAPAGTGRGTFVRIAGGAGGRLESEVQIVVDKALKGSVAYKRIGIAGSLAFLRRVGCALILLDTGSTRGGGGSDGSSSSGGVDGFELLLKEWRSRLDDLIAATEGHGAARALALGLISEMLKTPTITGGPSAAPPPPAAAVAAVGLGAPDAHLAGCWGSKLPAAALEQLTAVVQAELLEAALVVDLPLVSVPGQEGSGLPEVRVATCTRTFSCSVWLNVDEQETSVAINLWPLAASSAVADRDVLVWMAPCLSLVCLVSRIVFGDLQDVDGLLGCPLVMFPVELLQDEEGINHLHELPPAVSMAVLTCLQAASSWLREVINCFSPVMAAQPTGQTWSQIGTAKLAKRAGQLAMLEALAAALVENILPPRGGLAALGALRSHSEAVVRLQRRGVGTGSAIGGGAAAAGAVGAKRGGRGGGGACAAGGGTSTAGGTAASRAAAVLGFRRCIRSLSLCGAVETMRHLLTSRPPGVYGGAAAEVGSHRQEAPGRGDGDHELVDPQNWGAWTVLPGRLAAVAYLMSELAAKAAVVSARARNAPAFALSGPAAVAAADPSLARLTLADLAATLAAAMPYIRKHLDSATGALAGARILSLANNIYLQPVSDGDGRRLLAQLDAVQGPLEPCSTAAHYVMDTLDLLRTFFGSVVISGAGGGGVSGRGRGRGVGSGGAMSPPPPPAARTLAAVLACLAAKPATDGVPDVELKQLADAACPAVPGRALSSAQAEGLAQLAWKAFQQLASQCQGAGPVTPGDGEQPPENPPAPPDVWRELALLRTGRALIVAVRHLVAPDATPADWPDGLRRLAKAVSRSANKALENDWSGSGAAAAAGGNAGGGGADGDVGDGGGAGGGAGDDDADLAAARRSGGSFRWRGQGKLILELLRTYVDFSAKPLEVLKLLVTQAMAEVPEGRAGGGRGAAAAAAAAVSEPIAGYASLSDGTLAAWYRGVFEALLERWSVTCARMRASERRVPGQEEEHELMAETVASTDVFSKLMELLRKHPGRNPLITVAIKCGGKFVEDLARSTGAWRRLWDVHEDKLRRTVKSVQRGTRLLNTLCADGKERRAVALAAKVPAVKRAMETFLLNMRALFHEMGCADGIRIAQLKNKDIHGNEVASQAYGGFDDGDGDGTGFDDADGDGDGGGGFGGNQDDGDEEDGVAGVAHAAVHDCGRNKDNKRKPRGGGGGGGRGKRAAGGAAAEGDTGEGAAAAPKVQKPRAAWVTLEDGDEGAAAAAAGRKAKRPRKPKATGVANADVSNEGSAGVGADDDGAMGGAYGVKQEVGPNGDPWPSTGPSGTGKRPRTALDSQIWRRQNKVKGSAGGGENGSGGGGGGIAGGDLLHDVGDEEEEEAGEGEEDMYGELHGHNRRGMYSNFHAEGNDAEEEKEEEAEEVEQQQLGGGKRPAAEIEDGEAEGDGDEAGLDDHGRAGGW